jgi:hypothetical protein
VLLVANASDETEVQRRLADDPWVQSQRLAITRIESWMPMVGTERLARVS